LNKPKLGPKLAKARTLSVANLDAAIAASGLTQFELGELVGIEDRAVRRLLDPERKRADRLDLLCAIKRLGKERSCDEAIGEKPRALLVSAEPTNRVRSFEGAHGGHIASEEAPAAAEPRVALKLAAHSSGNRVHAEASSGGESAAAVAVAQPGSAPGFKVPEVVRSNRTSGPAKRRAA
jgi:hypothetical protein